jgi:SAM-dependent methyltransferase
MCGSGQATAWLLERGARVTGLDISDAAIEKFRGRFPQCAAIRASILESGLPPARFDGVLVMGGLHHVHPAVGQAVSEIHRVLRPGGWLGFGEPHAGSIADLGRRWWYRHDPLFEAGEAAIDLEALKVEFAGRFEFELERYVGSAAYLLVYNSMVFRVPLGLKRYYAPPLMALERALGFLHGRRTACFVLARWRKIPR